jgi:hypothetical protein
LSVTRISRKCAAKDRAESFIGRHHRNLLAELLSVDSIAISQEVPRRRIEREGFEHFLRKSIRPRDGSKVGVHNALSIMRKNDEDKQKLCRARVSRG